MIKKTITYPDLDGNPITEDFYFHLSRSELTEMQLSQDGGMEAYLKGIVASGNSAAIIELFKKIIEKAYGKRDPGGKRFHKSEEIWLDFCQSNAYDELFMELLNDEVQAAMFVKGILPSNLEHLTVVNEKVEETPEQPSVAPWIDEDREPTEKELREMSREQLMEVFKRKAERLATK